MLVDCDFIEGAGMLPATRCTSCGDVRDVVILNHRQHRPEPYAEGHGDPMSQGAQTLLCQQVDSGR